MIPIRPSTDFSGLPGPAPVDDPYDPLVDPSTGGYVNPALPRSVPPKPPSRNPFETPADREQQARMKGKDWTDWLKPDINLDYFSRYREPEGEPVGTPRYDFGNQPFTGTGGVIAKGVAEGLAKAINRPSDNPATKVPVLGGALNAWANTAFPAPAADDIPGMALSFTPSGALPTILKYGAQGPVRTAAKIAAGAIGDDVIDLAAGAGRAVGGALVRSSEEVFGQGPKAARQMPARGPRKKPPVPPPEMSEEQAFLRQQDEAYMKWRAERQQGSTKGGEVPPTPDPFTVRLSELQRAQEEILANMQGAAPRDKTDALRKNAKEIAKEIDDLLKEEGRNAMVPPGTSVQFNVEGWQIDSKGTILRGREPHAGSAAHAEWTTLRQQRTAAGVKTAARRAADEANRTNDPVLIQKELERVAAEEDRILSLPDDAVSQEEGDALASAQERAFGLNERLQEYNDALQQAGETAAVLEGKAGAVGSSPFNGATVLDQRTGKHVPITELLPKGEFGFSEGLTKNWWDRFKPATTPRPRTPYGDLLGTKKGKLIPQDAVDGLHELVGKFESPEKFWTALDDYARALKESRARINFPPPPLTAAEREELQRIHGGLPPLYPTEAGRVIKPEPGGIEYGHAETVRTDPLTPPAYGDVLGNDPAFPKYTYPGHRSRADLIASAEAYVKADPLQATAEFFNTAIGRTGNITENDVAVGQVLEDYYARQGDIPRALSIAAVLNPAGTELGRAVDAFGIANKWSPSGVLSMYERLKREAQVAGKMTGAEMEAHIAKLSVEAKKRAIDDMYRKATDLLKEANRQTQAIKDYIAGKPLPVNKLESKENRAAKSNMMRTVTFLENWGRNPLHRPAVPDEMRAILTELRGLSNQVGWVMDPAVADYLRSEVANATKLGNPEWTKAALLDLAQEMGKTYLPPLRESAAAYKEAVGNIGAAQAAIREMADWGRNPKNTMVTNPQRAILAEMERLSNKTGYVLPPHFYDALTGALEDMRKMYSAAPAEATAMRDRVNEFINGMGTQYLDGLRQRSREMDVTANLTKRVENGLANLSSHWVYFGKNPPNINTARDELSLSGLQKLAKSVGWLMSDERMLHYAESLDKINGAGPGPGTKEAVEGLIRDIQDEFGAKLEGMRQDARDVKRLSEATVRQAKQERTGREEAIARARSFLSKNDLNASVDFATDIMERAKALDAMSPADRYFAQTAIMHDLAALVPASKIDAALDVLGITRTLKTAWDFSAPFRQGWALGAGHPVEFAKAFKPMFEAAMNPSYARNIDASLHTGPMSKFREPYVYLAPTEYSGFSTTLTREETFPSTLARKIPWVAASERAYVTFLNVLRANVFDQTVYRWTANGVKYTEKDLKDLGQFINWATGRGSLPKNTEGLSRVLSATFFSPRFAMSRVELPFAGAKAAVSGVAALAGKESELLYSPHVAKEVGRDLGAFMAGGAALMGLVGLYGMVTGDAKVETDPRSADFGKGHIGPLRFDVWSGEQPVARTVAQLVTNQRVSSTGKTVDADRWMTVGRYLRSKLSPTAGTGIDLITGETYEGKELLGPNAPLLPTSLNPKDFTKSIIVQQLLPLLLQDTLEAYNVGGLAAAAVTVGPVAFGVGVQSYQTLRDLQDEAATQIKPGAKYDKLDTEERREANDSPKVRASIEDYTAGNAPTQQQAAPVLNAAYQSEKKRLEDTFADAIINQKPVGRVKREYIQNFLTMRYENAQATLLNAMLKPKEKITNSDRDSFAEAYWSIDAPFTPDGPDFKTQQAARAKVLTDAASMGIARNYILGTGKDTFRGERFVNSDTGRLILEYEAQRDKLRPYWEVETTMRDTYPALKEILGKLDEAERDAAVDPSPTKIRRLQAFRGNSTIQRFNRAISAQREAMRLRDPELENAGLSLGYFEIPIRLRKAG